MAAEHKPPSSRRSRCCRRQRRLCRLALWLELMVGIIMTILGLFILLLSIESLREGDYPAVYFCSLFIVLGAALLLVYYVHYYGLKCWIKRQVQRLDASIRSDRDALAALARRSFNFSGIAGPVRLHRQVPAVAEGNSDGSIRAPVESVVWELRQSLV